MVQPPRRLHSAAVVTGPRRPRRARDRAGGDGEQEARGDEHDHPAQSEAGRLRLLRARGWVFSHRKCGRGGSTCLAAPGPPQGALCASGRVASPSEAVFPNAGRVVFCPDHPRIARARVSRWSGLRTARWCGSFGGLGQGRTTSERCGARRRSVGLPPRRDAPPCRRPVRGRAPPRSHRLIALQPGRGVTASPRHDGHGFRSTTRCRGFVQRRRPRAARSTRRLRGSPRR